MDVSKELGRLFINEYSYRPLLLLIANILDVQDILSLTLCNKYLRDILLKEYTGPFTYQSVVDNPYRLSDFDNMVVSTDVYRLFRKIVCMIYITTDFFEITWEISSDVIMLRSTGISYEQLEVILSEYNTVFLTFEQQLTSINSQYRGYIEERQGILIGHQSKMDMLILSGLILKENSITIIDNGHNSNAISYSLIHNFITFNDDNTIEIIWRYSSDQLLGKFLRKLKEDGINNVDKISIITDDITTDYCPLKEILLTQFKCNYDIIGHHNCENVKKFKVSRYKDRGTIITCELDDSTIAFLQQSPSINISSQYQANKTNIIVRRI